jgi:glucan-binding YG repeat protein
VKPKSPAQLTAAQKLEQQQILSILLDDAGKDWKPRNKGRTSTLSGTHACVGKTQHKPQQTKQSSKQAPVAHKQAPVAHKQAPVAHKQAPAKPLTPAQQREQLEILSILIDFKEPPAKVAPKQAAKPVPAAHNKPTQSKPTPTKTPTKSQPVQHKPQPAQNKSQPTQNKQNVQPTKHIVKNQPRGVKMTT